MCGEVCGGLGDCESLPLPVSVIRGTLHGKGGGMMYLI